MSSVANAASLPWADADLLALRDGIRGDERTDGRVCSSRREKAQIFKRRCRREHQGQSLLTSAATDVFGDLALRIVAACEFDGYVIS